MARLLGLRREVVLRDGSVLTDSDHDRVLWLRGKGRAEITLHRAVPLPFLTLVAVRSVEDWSVALEAGEWTETSVMSGR